MVNIMFNFRSFISHLFLIFKAELICKTGGSKPYESNVLKMILNQLLQLCTARTAWSDSVMTSETSLITESDRSGPIR